jgi:putative PEP-CTERM system TPR-repeat lipoprotein
MFAPSRRTRTRALAAAALAAAALGAFAQTGAAPPASGKSSRFYEDALVRYEKRDYSGAIVQLKNALQADRTQLAVHVLLGKALLATSDVAAAEVAFNEALRLGVNRAEVVVPLARAVAAQGRPQAIVEEPRFAPAGLPADVQAQVWLLRGAALADLGDMAGAMKAIEEARARDPGNAQSWLAEVPIRIRAGRFDEAARAADRALAISPDSAEANYLRGTLAHARGDSPGALSSYGRALSLDPAHTEALVSRAGLLMDMGQATEAKRDVSALLRGAPEDPRGFYLQALIAESEGNAALAKSSLNRITGLLDPVPIAYLRYRPQALMLGGLAHYGLGQFEKAKPYLDAALRAQPNTGVAKLLARIHLSDGSNDRAIELLEPYVRAHPGDSQAILLLASAQMAVGRHGRATQLMQGALQSQDDPQLRTLLGMSLIGSGKFADAAGELEAAFAKDPSQLQAGVALATMYLQSGQAPRALKVARTLVQQRPSAPGVQNLLGLALARTGDTAGARTAFEAAARLDPTFVEPQIQLARLDTDAGAFDAAGARLNALLQRDDKNVAVLGELGRLAERRGQPAEAQRWLEKADDFGGPGNLQPGLALVEFHLRSGNAAAAQEAMKRLTGRAPDALPVLLAAARVALANRDASGARTALTRATGIAAYNPTVLLQIALLQVAAADLAGAAHALDKALGERPGFVPAQALRAEIDIRMGEYAKAEARIRQIVAANPRSAMGPGLQGDLALARGQRPAAVDAYRRAQQLEPSSANLQRLLAVLLVTDPAGGAQLAEQWLKQHPADRGVRRALADAQARSGNLAAARAGYEALVKADPGDAEALNNLANIMLLTNDPGALRVAEQALQRSPRTPHIIGTAGWAAYKAGQTDRALQLLRDARLRDPGNAETRYFLGTVLASTGRTTEAREELQAALRSGPFPSAREAERLLATLK